METTTTYMRILDSVQDFWKVSMPLAFKEIGALQHRFYCDGARRKCPVNVHYAALSPANVAELLSDTDVDHMERVGDGYLIAGRRHYPLPIVVLPCPYMTNDNMVLLDAGKNPVAVITLKHEEQDNDEKQN